MGNERILVMNLGSTSSKIAVYDNDKELELKEGDKVLIYTKENLRKYMKEPLF